MPWPEVVCPARSRPNLSAVTLDPRTSREVSVSLSLSLPLLYTSHSVLCDSGITRSGVTRGAICLYQHKLLQSIRRGSSAPASDIIEDCCCYSRARSRTLTSSRPLAPAAEAPITPDATSIAYTYFGLGTVDKRLCGNVDSRQPLGRGSTEQTSG